MNEASASATSGMTTRPHAPIIPATARGRRAWHVVAEGRSMALEAGERVVVGSAHAPATRLRLADPCVSKRHCTLRADDLGVWIEDLGSTNGTTVEGRRVERERLQRGAVAFVGRTPMLITESVGRRCHGAMSWQGMIGRSERTLELWAQLALTGAAAGPVWLHGESGTGKELAARAIHETSPRASGPWVAINCAALPHDLAEAELFGVVRGAFTGASRDRSGAFASADGGTLLLDEIGELPLSIQAKLLRVLEQGEVMPVGADRPTRVDVRVIAATWKDLEAEALDGRFRHDLLHRLWVLRVNIPPLRRRPQDVAPLIEAMLSGSGLWPENAVMRAAEAGTWPGNVRQLGNHVRRALCHGDAARVAPDPDPTGRRPALRRGSSEPVLARAHIRDTLLDHRGRRESAAAALGISRSTLYRWLRDFQ